MKAIIAAAFGGVAYIALDQAGFRPGYSSNVGFAVVDSGSLKLVVSIVAAILGPIVAKYFPALSPLIDKIKVDGFDVLTPNGLMEAFAKLRDAYPTNQRLRDAVKVVVEESINEMFKPSNAVRTIYLDSVTGKQIVPPVNPGV